MGAAAGRFACCANIENNPNKQNEVCLVSVENINFDVFPIDPHAPRNYFARLDVKFGGKHNMAEMLSSFPQRRLAVDILRSIWKHYFVEPFENHNNGDIHNPLHKNDTHSQWNNNTIQGLPSAKPFIINNYSSQLKYTSSLPQISEAGPPTSEASLKCMSYFITDVLRYDLAVIQDGYEQVHRKALESNREIDMTSPVLSKMKNDVIRLAAMPIDYMALLVTKNILYGDCAHQATNRTTLGPHNLPPLNVTNSRFAQDSPTTSTQNQVKNSQRSTRIPPTSDNLNNQMANQNNAAVPFSPDNTFVNSTPELNPASDDLKKSLESMDLNESFVNEIKMAAYAGAAVSEPLNEESFLTGLHGAMLCIFDRFYRKGFWMMFCLNVSHSIHLLTAHANILNANKTAKIQSAANNPALQKSSTLSLLNTTILPHNTTNNKTQTINNVYNLTSIQKNETTRTVDRLPSKDPTLQSGRLPNGPSGVITLSAPVNGGGGGGVGLPPLNRDKTMDSYFQGSGHDTHNVLNNHTNNTSVNHPPHPFNNSSPSNSNNISSASHSRIFKFKLPVGNTNTTDTNTHSTPFANRNKINHYNPHKGNTESNNENGPADVAVGLPVIINKSLGSYNSFSKKSLNNNPRLPPIIQQT